MEYPDYSARKGIWKPTRTDDLREGVSVHIGKEFYFRYAWTIDEEDGGNYVGQVAYTVTIGEGWDSGSPEPYIGWAPEEDIDFLTEPPTAEGK